MARLPPGQAAMADQKDAPGQQNGRGEPVLGKGIYALERITDKQKILIVDDSEMNRSILADMLGLSLIHI